MAHTVILTHSYVSSPVFPSPYYWECPGATRSPMEFQWLKPLQDHNRSSKGSQQQDAEHTEQYGCFPLQRFHWETTFSKILKLHSKERTGDPTQRGGGTGSSFWTGGNNKEELWPVLYTLLLDSSRWSCRLIKPFPLQLVHLPVCLGQSIKCYKE